MKNFKAIALGCVLLSQVCPAVTSLQGRFSGGKTFITFTEDAGSGNTYNIYRESSPISDVTGRTPIANIATGSSFDKNYSLYHVVTDSGAPLSATTGIFVYTPKDSASAYYAVTVVKNNTEDKTIALGSNSLNAAVNEQYWPVPRGILRQFINNSGWLMYYYEYWMDHSTWPDSALYYTYSYYGAANPGHGYESYGVYYTIGVPPANQWQGLSKLPVQIFLHSLSSAGFSLPARTAAGMIAFGVNDPNNTFFTFCTKDRIAACLKSFLNDARFTPYTDTERVVMLGTSMGACGTFEMSYDEPGLFSACNPQWGDPIDYGHISQMVNSPSVDRPPMLDFFGAYDGLNWGIYAHRRTINTYEKTRQGIWAKWEAVSHGGTTSGVFDDHVPGGPLRFKRHELFPAFSNSTLDNKYGAVDTSDFVPEGRVNSGIDWSSSLHDLGLPNDQLIDNADSVAITFKALKPGAAADITPRRAQKFKPAAGKVFHWRNQDVASGEVVAGGAATADTAKQVTVAGFAVSQTGSRLFLTGNDPAGFVKITVLDSVKGTPVPGVRAALSTLPVSSRLTDTLGQALILASTGSLTLNLSRSSFVSRSGITVAVVQDDTTAVTVRLLQLNVTGLVISPDTFVLGQYFTYTPATFTRHTDNALYPAAQGIAWSANPANRVSISGNTLTALTVGGAEVVAALGAFSDTLHLTVVDTAALADSVVLSYSAKEIDANAPFALHAVATFKKTTDHTFFFNANIDSTGLWTTSNAQVATVVKGLVTGHDSGTVRIVARAGAKTDTCLMTIRPTPAFIKRVNFAAPQNPIVETVWFATGWTLDNANAYSAAAGLGWLPGGALDYRSDRATTNFLLKSFVTTSTPRVYQLDAPDGQYVIRTAVGDNIYGNTRSWIAFGADTLMIQELTDTVIGTITYKDAKYNKIEDDTITVSSGTGIQLMVSGKINYLVAISAEGIPMDLVADDDGVPDDPPDTAQGHPGALEKRNGGLITTAALAAFPNPFNPAVTIAYTLPAGRSGSYRIYNMRGQVVFAAELAAAARGLRGEIHWNGRNLREARVGSGFFVGRLTVKGGKTLTHKLLFLK